MHRNTHKCICGEHQFAARSPQNAACTPSLSSKHGNARMPRAHTGSTPSCATSVCQTTVAESAPGHRAPLAAERNPVALHMSSHSTCASSWPSALRYASPRCWQLHFCHICVLASERATISLARCRARHERRVYFACDGCLPPCEPVPPWLLAVPPCCWDAPLLFLSVQSKL